MRQFHDVFYALQDKHSITFDTFKNKVLLPQLLSSISTLVESGDRDQIS